MCFMDRTFCSANCEALSCSRNKARLAVGGDLNESYLNWSKSFKPGGPVSMSDFSEDFPAYIPSDEHE